MPSRKKNKKRNQKSSTSRTAKKSVARGKTRTLKAIHKKPSRKKSTTRSSGRAKKASVNTARELEQEFRNQRKTPEPTPSNRQLDFQGLSRAEDADSESVDELVEEGNAFEAGAIAGVEEADSSDEREVHTHEVPEDDVPEEYRDRD
jgi:hypothetical protein